MPVKLICQECGEEYWVRPSYVTKSRFCSRKCANRAHSREISGVNHPRYGEHLLESTRVKISKAHKGKPSPFKGKLRQTVTCQCIECDKLFAVRPFEAKTRKFCSRVCSWKWYWKQKSPKKKCLICGKEIPRGRKFCSIKCYGTWLKQHLREKFADRRIEVNCGWCGKEFEICKCAFKKINFCSKQCWYQWFAKAEKGKGNPHWKGGYLPYYGPNWDEMREATRKRDNFTCRLCKITEDKLGKALDVHHIVPFRVFGLQNYIQANSLPNLISFCPSCHKYIESHDSSHISIKSLHISSKSYQPLLPLLSQI